MQRLFQLLISTFFIATLLFACTKKSSKPDANGASGSGGATSSATDSSLESIADAKIVVTTKALIPIIIPNNGEAMESCDVSPSLPAGVEINVEEGTCVISGTPTEESPETEYTITGTTLSGVNHTATVTLAINLPSPADLADAADQTYTQDQAIATLTFTNSGSAVVACAISPDLPAGLAIEVASNTCEIYGTPTDTLTATDFIVTATAADTSDATANVRITVNSAPPPCPTGYVLVPAYTDVYITVPSFCVMKYEAKDEGGVPVSKAADTPWVLVARGTTASTAGGAWKACRDLNSGGDTNYDLITNDQWNSIARQIDAATASGNPSSYLNWSNNSRSGANSINRGNYNENSLLAADADDANACTGMSGENDDCDGVWKDKKRTHTFSNGEVIWDIAGNAWEWVQENSNFSYGLDVEWYSVGATSGNQCQTPGCTGPQGYGKQAFGPIEDYSAKNSGAYGGLGKAILSYTGGGIQRGGYFNEFTGGSGVYGTNLIQSYSGTFNNTSFRCVYNLD